MKPEAKYFSTTLGGKEVTFETGRIARQAGGSVILRQGDSMMFAAATMGAVREGSDFFPLTVDYEERMYAGGRIPGSFFRREGRPSTDATLVARLTDRPLRPLFPEGMRNEVQVVLMSLSADTENPLDMLAINAASAALMISDIPFSGPVGAVRVGFVDGKLVVNPSLQEMEISTLDLRVAGTKEAILMVEAGANEVTEILMAEALQLAHESIQPIIDAQLRMAAEVGKAKREVKLAEKDANLLAQAKDAIRARLEALLDQEYSKETLYGGIAEIKEAYILELAGEELHGGRDAARQCIPREQVGVAQQIIERQAKRTAAHLDVAHHPRNHGHRRQHKIQAGLGPGPRPPRRAHKQENGHRRKSGCVASQEGCGSEDRTDHQRDQPAPRRPLVILRPDARRQIRRQDCGIKRAQHKKERGGFAAGHRAAG